MAYWGKGGCDQYFSEQNSDPIQVEFHSLEHTSTNKLRLTEQRSMGAGPKTSSDELIPKQLYDKLLFMIGFCRGYKVWAICAVIKILETSQPGGSHKHSLKSSLTK